MNNDEKNAALAAPSTEAIEEIFSAVNSLVGEERSSAIQHWEKINGRPPTNAKPATESAWVRLKSALAALAAPPTAGESTAELIERKLAGEDTKQALRDRIEAYADNYVAWARFTDSGRIVLCDSDAAGAFKVYRAAPPVELRIGDRVRKGQGYALPAKRAALPTAGLDDFEPKDMALIVQALLHMSNNADHEQATRSRVYAMAQVLRAERRAARAALAEPPITQAASEIPLIVSPALADDPAVLPALRAHGRAHVMPALSGPTYPLELWLAAKKAAQAASEEEP